MRNFLVELFRRNKSLLLFGWFNFFMAILCIGLLAFDHTIVLGSNVWMKPFKFYFSAGLMSWTMGWLLYSVNSKISRNIFSWVIIISFLFENGIVFIQSWRGVASHFNVKTPFDTLMNNGLLLFIVLFFLDMLMITIVLFSQKKMPLSQHYSWGVRMGLLIFLILSIVGFGMFLIQSHTIGGEDGTKGVMLFNWSKKHGDLRIVHFMGVHALQIIPLVSYYLFEKKKQVINFSITYLIVAIVLLILALIEIPIIPK
jgi:hypothetical protein